jgi:hypothetical protein
MCLGIKKELLERDFDKESVVGEIGLVLRDSGGLLGDSLESELRGLDEEMVKIFDSELRG